MKSKLKTKIAEHSNIRKKTKTKVMVWFIFASLIFSNGVTIQLIVFRH